MVISIVFGGSRLLNQIRCTHTDSNCLIQFAHALANNDLEIENVVRGIIITLNTYIQMSAVISN